MELHFNINLSPKFGMTMCIVKYAGIELVINLQGDLHGGYYDKESNSWICKDCFTELKGVFHWKESDIS